MKIILQVLRKNAFTVLRINIIKKYPLEDFLKISPFELEPIPWIENGSIFMRKTSLQSTRIILRDCTICRNQAQ